MIFLSRAFRFLKYYTNLKSIYLNFKLLPFSKAIYLPIDCAKNVQFKRLTGKIEISSNLFFRGMIEIGKGDVTHIDKSTNKTILDIPGILEFKGPAHIGHGSVLRVQGKLSLGENFRITAKSTIIAEKLIEIGKDCLISWDVLIMDTDQHSIYDNFKNCLNLPNPIEIKEKVWIGCRSIILKGSGLGSGAIVGAGSLVNKRIMEQNCIVVGNPAKIVKKDISWS